ncbi:protein translocase subunit SecF [Candidatus Peregrinibacteria bacterium]|nr:protein translocase subunit SecF [Candidatus Peregrinibacteria bacterium]
MKRPIIYSGIIVLAAIFLGFFSLPGETQKQLIPFTPEAVTSQEINLGLDLQGGSQLDYKIDLRNVPEEDKGRIVEGILNVINKRVNSLGVSEPNIFTSDYGDEKHIIVELAGIEDLEEAKAVVGKTIQLEFKEQKENVEPTEEVITEVKNIAQNSLSRINEGTDFSVVGREEEQAHPGDVFYTETEEWVYEDNIDESFKEQLLSLEPGQTYNELIENEQTSALDEQGQIQAGPTTFQLVKLLDKQETERTIENPRSVKVSHILVAYKDAERADPSIERSKDEAKARAEEVLNKLNEGGDFAELAKEYSDAQASAENGGALSDPVIKDSGNYVKEFENAAIALQNAGETSPITETIYGFHILKADEIAEVKTETVNTNQYKFASILYIAQQDPWQDTGLTGEQFVRADAQIDQQTLQPYVEIHFNAEGAKLFEEITERNIGKPLAIFVGGQLISAPNVNQAISGGNAVIQGNFTVETADDLARDLNTGAIPAPITLAGQHTIGASLGADSLQRSLSAGGVGLILVILFMIAYYRLPGLLSSVALGAYAAILIFLIKAALPLPYALLIAILLFIILIYRIANTDESGVEKSISALLAVVVLFFVTFILSQSVVLTLAGVAGVILSIGMAVDANILIFERIKEELNEGRPLSGAIEVGFDRAWASIRDSNFSSLITCAILFFFGHSIIKGFAFNLAAGILVSMFTAISITKTFLFAAAKTSLGKSLGLFNKSRKTKAKKQLPFVKNRKKFYLVSTVLVAATVIGIPTMGMNLGLDFTGGTLMEFSFSNEVSKEQIHESLLKHEDKLTSGNTETTPSEGDVITASENEVDMNKAKVLASETGFIVKTPHITTAQHDILVEAMKTDLGEFEETRFTTVGPTVGNTLKERAFWALAIAVAMIILYIGFAFRKVPKYVGKWKFGITAIAALIHDLAIMLGVYLVLGVTLGVEIDALFITAMLTVLGFSVHDTIVVFDRIREKLKYQKREESFGDVANQALNDTMARSINTSISTLFVLATLVWWGPESIKFFVLALIVGIISGTYSSIFVATPLLVDWQEKSQKNK